MASHPNVLPSSTNPTRPYTRNTLDEHLDMLMVCHHLNSSIPEDLAFAESRIRPSTMAAEDVLHDLGAISMIGSDSQAMGRIGETIIRTWQTAHVMKQRRGALPGDGAADNNRARRYVAKYTIGPAVTHGLDGEIGSVAAGQAGRPGAVGAGLLRRPAAPRAEGRRDRLGQHGRRERVDPDPAAAAAAADVRRVRRDAGPAGRALRLPRRARGRPGRAAGTATGGWCRPGTCPACPRPSLPENDALPRIDVDSETFAVRVDGELIEPEPATELPMAQRYFLF